MPTIDIDYAEFEALLGLRLHKDQEKIDDILAFVKGEVKVFDEKDQTMSIEIKDTNRPDLWSIEGLVRTLRGFLGIKEGLLEYKVGKESAEVYVDAKLERIRPYIGCSIVKNLKLTDGIIRGLMHMQDKLDQTYGRNRRRTSIGLYNLDLVKLPLYYTVIRPEDVSFVPLGFTEKMTLGEMLVRHPKGLEYGKIVEAYEYYPILLDSEKTPLSFPPIINSNGLGKITEETRNILVEVTGTSLETVLNTLKMVTLSLLDRGGKVYASRIHYMHSDLNDVLTPNLETRTMQIDVDFVKGILGLELTARQISKLLPKAGYGIDKLSANELTVQIPCYRIDIMHQVDVVEDIAIAYDYNNINPIWRETHTTGGARPERALMDLARELMIGLGFQETVNYTLSNPDNLFAKMKVEKEKIVEILNPKVVTLTCLRNWVLPSLIEFVSSNLHVELPQKIFELGKVTLVDEFSETKTRDEERLTGLIYHASANFSEIKSVLAAFFMNIGVEWTIKKCEHASFIDGRVGAIEVNGKDVGVFGEINPEVLQNWKLENPVAAFELNFTEILRRRQHRLGHK
jgi:phenylalanyl-tRNA synthetase beta chain